MENWSFLVRLLFISRLLMTRSLQPCPARSLGWRSPEESWDERGHFHQTSRGKAARRESPCPAWQLWGSRDGSSEHTNSTQG